MKIRVLALGVMLSAFGVAGCGDDEATGPGAIQSLSFLADGAQFTAASGSATRSGNTVTLTASATSTGITRSISIAIQSAAQGTIEVGGAGSPEISYSEQSTTSGLRRWAAGVGSGSGTLVITQLSATKAIGTFIVTLPPVTATGATAARTLTSGSFNLTF